MCNKSHNPALEHFHNQKSTLMPICCWSQLPTPIPLNYWVPSLSIEFAFPRNLTKWNNAVYRLLSLAFLFFFTLYSTFAVQQCCSVYQWFISFWWSIVLHCVHTFIGLDCFQFTATKIKLWQTFMHKVLNEHFFFISHV